MTLKDAQIILEKTACLGVKDNVYFSLREACKVASKYIRDQTVQAKSGVVYDDEFVKFDDGTYIDFRDPTLSDKPAFIIPKNGTKVRVILIEEMKKR